MFTKALPAGDSFFFIENQPDDLQPIDRRSSSTVVKTAIYKTLMFIYFPLTLASITNFFCTTIDEKDYLVADRSVECYAHGYDDHYQLVYISLGVALIMGAGLPLLILYAIRRKVLLEQIMIKDVVAKESKTFVAKRYTLCCCCIRKHTQRVFSEKSLRGNWLYANEKGEDHVVVIDYNDLDQEGAKDKATGLSIVFKTEPRATPPPAPPAPNMP